MYLLAQFYFELPQPNKRQHSILQRFTTFDYPLQYLILLPVIVIGEECVFILLSNAFIFKMNSTVGICCLDKEND